MRKKKRKEKGKTKLIYYVDNHTHFYQFIDSRTSNMFWLVKRIERKIRQTLGSKDSFNRSIESFWLHPPSLDHRKIYSIWP